VRVLLVVLAADRVGRDLEPVDSERPDSQVATDEAHSSPGSFMR